jgi:hypothetical protein
VYPGRWPPAHGAYGETEIDMKTAAVCQQMDAEAMRSHHFTEGAIEGVLHIRGLDDEPLLAAARDEDGAEHAAVVAYMSRDGSWTNPSWVTSQCAEEAYDRGLLGEQEFDWITR